jgi:hypothetical protein
MDLRKIGLEGLDWIHQAQDRDQWGGGGESCEHCKEPSGFIKGGEFLDYLSNYWLLKRDFAT